MKKEKEYELILCNICGELLDPREQVIVKGTKGAICETCVFDTMDLISVYVDPAERLMGKRDPEELDSDIKPSKIHEHLNDYVIGQEYAKQVLSVAVYNHYKSLHYGNMDVRPVDLDKSNVMLVGPTGSGKTHLIKTLARTLKVPYAMADACTLTEAGLS